jgi:hypothetical protein
MPSQQATQQASLSAHQQASLSAHQQASLSAYQPATLSPAAFSPVDTTFLTENSPRFSIKNRWLVDSATSKYISNDRSLFVEFKQTNGTLKVGDTTT